MVFRRYNTGFVGRKDELARLDAALRAAADARPDSVLVAGEAGVGKTRLVSTFADRAHDRGVRVLAGGCVDVSGGGLPYGPIVEAFRGLERDLGPPAVRELLGADHAEMRRLLLTGDGTAPTPAAGGLAQARLFELVLRVLHRLGEASPVLMVMEDLHWADRSTLDLLGFLVRNLATERLLIVATQRSDEQPSGTLRDFRAEFGRVAGRIELSRFGREDLAALLAEVLGGAPPAAIVDQVLALSEGNAFFAEELVTAGLDQPLGWLTPRLRDVLMSRVELLSDDAQETLRVAAVIGRRVDHGLLAAASAWRGQRLLTALRETATHQILITDREGLYVFRHALAREAVYGDLTAGERLALHAAVANALAADSSRIGLGAAAAAELAHHWYEAHDLPRALAATIESAHHSAAVYAFAEADGQYQRALDLWDRVPADDRPADLGFARLLEEAAEAARWAGDAERATLLVRRALAEVDRARDPGRTGGLRERLGLYLWEGGDGKRSLEVYEETNRLLAGEPPSTVRARVLAAYGAALMLSSRYREARAPCEEAIAMARAVGARGPEMHAQNTLGFAVALLGEPDDGIAWLERSRQMAEADEDVEGACRAYTNLATVLLLVGRLERADEVAQRGIAMTRRLGIELTGGAVLLGILASIRFRLGDWDATEALAEEVVARPVPHGLALFAHITQVEVQTGRGRLDVASASLDAARALAREVTDPLTLGQLDAAAAELAIWGGDHQAARAAVASGLRAVAGSDEDHLVLRLCALGTRAEADQAERVPPRRAAAELPKLEAVAGSLLARAGVLAGVTAESSASFREASIHAMVCLAEYARLDRRPDAATWGAVAAAWKDFHSPFPAAYARWRQGEALLQEHDHPGATRALREALVEAAALGATRLRDEINLLAARGHVDLREPGLPRERPGPPSAPADEFRLTPREREVLRQVATGRTNRQIARALFITEKTASVHVSNIIAKLGVANRGQAGALAQRLGLVDTALPFP
jgi:DNA-binding CsgD family transcriptional regulator/tetratricopeptide (TPR) repeat protein